MRLYSIKHLLLALVCVLPIIKELTSYDGVTSLIWIAFFGCMIYRCVVTAFSEELVEKDELEAERDRKVRRKMYGNLWRVPPILFMLMPIMVGAAAFSLLWPSVWAGVLLFLGIVGSVAYALRFNVKYRRLMEQLERRK